MSLTEFEQSTPTAQVAPETHDENHDDIPYATPIFDTKKLYKRWAKCCEFALHIAYAGLKHADNMQTQATITGTLGLLFGSESMQKSATETHNQAHETRKSTIYFAAVFLLASIAATSIYWAVEEGVVGLVAKSISACASACYSAFSAAGSWIKSKAMDMFNRSNEQGQNIPLGLKVGSDLELNELKDSSVSQDETLHRQPTFIPSGGPNTTTPSAPPIGQFDYDAKISVASDLSLSLS